MFFEQESIVFSLLNVYRIQQGCERTYHCNRTKHALSFRFEADTIIETAKSHFHITDSLISYVSSYVDYYRTSAGDDMIVIDFELYGYQADDWQTFSPGDSQKYAVLFQMIHQCWQEKETGYRHEAASLFSKILAELYRDTHMESRSRSKILRSIQYIEKNFLKKDFSLQTAARESHISDAYFRRLFQAEFRTSPKKYVIERRLQYAAALIRSGYFSLQQVADMCGYEDYKHFSTEFKRHMNISPSRCFTSDSPI